MNRPSSRRFPPMLTYFLFFSAALLFWEVFLALQLRGGRARSGWAFLLFLPAQALLPTLLCGWKRTPRLNRALPVLCTATLSVYYLTQLIYFRTFGSLLSVSLMGMGGAALGNFGWAMMPVLKGSVGVIALFLLPLALSLLFLRKDAAPGYDWRLHLAAPAAMALLWAAGAGALRLGGTGGASPYAAYHNAYMDTDTAASRLGALTTTLLEGRSYLFGSGAEPELILPLATPAPSAAPEDAESGAETDARQRNILEALDFAALEERTEDPQIKELCRYFSSLPGTSQNEYTGLFEGCNLIYICAESFSSFALDEDVTPTLCRLASGGVILENYYNSFRNTTTNGEYALLTGLWPDVSRDARKGTAVGSMPQSADKLMPFGLGTLFRQEGYVSRGYHNYIGEYYFRNLSLPNLGYECKFMNDGMTFTPIWPSSDLEMMEQSVDDYIAEERFHAYYMTFSGHGGYGLRYNGMASKNYPEVRRRLGERAEAYSEEALCYLACNLELDRAMEYLLKRLEEAGKLESTVIVLAGDHTPYYLSDDGVAQLAGHRVDMDFELYHDTCILWCGALEAEPIRCGSYCCNVDILPTVLNLFGIPYDSRLLPGTDVFSEGPHVAALYNKSFLTEEFLYNAAGDTLETADGKEGITDAVLRGQAEAISALVSARYAASLKMMDADLFRFVWRESGLE